MVPCNMRALPEAWQNDLLKSVQGSLPETVRELLPLLELIEKSPPTSAPKHESAKGKSENGGGAGKKHSMESVNDRIPRKKARFQPCALCTKHGGNPNTHLTEKQVEYKRNPKETIKV